MSASIFRRTRNIAPSVAERPPMDPLFPIVPWHAHATTVLVVHMVWSTRNRVPWLEPALDGWLAALLERKAHALDCRLVASGNAPDHVHALVCYPPRVSVAQIAHRLKGASSRAIHLALPRRRGSSGRSATGPSASLRPRASRSSPTSEDSEGRSRPRRGLGSKPPLSAISPPEGRACAKDRAPGFIPGETTPVQCLQQPRLHFWTLAGALRGARGRP